MTVSKEELYTKFIIENKTLNECAFAFGCSVGQIRVLLKKYDIKKVQEIFVDKDSLFNYYIVENHTLGETMEHFNLSKTCLCDKLRKNGIVKPAEDRKRPAQNKVILKKEDVIHYYIDLNYTLEETAKILNCSCKVLLRRLKEFDIIKDTQKRYENVSKSCLKNNGVSSPILLDSVKEKIKKTNQDKYGVPYACMREEYHKFKGSNSKVNQNFEKKLQKLDIDFQKEFNLDSFLYDFKIDNILIELNPTITHNSTNGIFYDKPKDKNYHFNKSITAQNHGFHCIHVFDWDNEEKIIDLFLRKKDKVYARNCETREISKDMADNFLNQYHLQGKSRGNIVNIGLFYDNELVELMTFGKPRYNKKYQWELLRLCSCKNVIGGSAKILKHFEDKYEPKSIVSYCDFSKFNGEVYKSLGFNLLSMSKPCKHWCSLDKKAKRQHITDNMLRKHGFDQLFGTNYGKGTSNEELMLKQNYVVVYDCGQLTYLKEF